MKNFVKSPAVTKVFLTAALSINLFFIAGPIEAQAGPNLFYYFQFIGANGSVNGKFEVQPGGGSGSFPDKIVGITGKVENYWIGNGSITGLLSPGTYLSNNNYFSSTPRYLPNYDTSFNTGGGVGFTTGTYNFSLNYETFEGLDVGYVLNSDDGTTAYASYGTLAISQ